jgi:hypothetical protein
MTRPPLDQHLPRHIRGSSMGGPHHPMAHCSVREIMVASCACSCDSSLMACLSLATAHVLPMHRPALQVILFGFASCNATACGLWNLLSPRICMCAQHNSFLNNLLCVGSSVRIFLLSSTRVHALVSRVRWIGMPHTSSRHPLWLRVAWLLATYTKGVTPQLHDDVACE